jgi:hypothetical protein
MSAQHTPGPWEIRRGSSGYPYQITAPQQSPHRPGGITHITRWAAISLLSSAEGEANARLIAASRSGAAALQEVVSALNGRVHSTPALAALEFARAAIAKATGGAA